MSSCSDWFKLLVDNIKKELLNLNISKTTSWLIFTLVVLAISYLAVILWAIYKR